MRDRLMPFLLTLGLLLIVAASAWAGAGGGSGGTGLLVKGSIPEPASLLALATGIGGALYVRWRRK